MTMGRLLGSMGLGVLTACVTVSPPPQFLPPGVYHHDVSVLLEGKDPQRFVGLMKIEGEHLTMVMLSPFGTTLARVTDELHRDVSQVVVYADELKPVQDKIAAVYQGLKPAFIDTQTTQARIYGRELTVRHEGVALPGVPKVTSIAGEGIRMDVEVTGYEKNAGR